MTLKLDSNIILTDKLTKRFVRSLSEIEQEIWEAVQKLLFEFKSEGGFLVPDSRSKELIGLINKEIRKILRDAHIKDEVSNFIDDFDLLDKNIKAIQQNLNGIDVKQSIFNAQRQFAIDATVNSLVESNINLKFVDPVKKILYNRVSFGSSVVDAEKQLRQIVVGNKDHFGVLQRWVGQIARDAINEYQGTINQQIKVQYELTNIRYIGPLVEDSRAQCVRWINQLNGIISDDQLQSEIDWAYRNGSGMKPETTPENFCQNRGGWNCIHEAIPVRKR